MSDNITRGYQRTPSPVRSQRLLSPTQTCTPSVRLSASKIERRELYPYNLDKLQKIDSKNNSLLNNNKFQANKLLDAYSKTESITHQLKVKQLQSDIQTSKILVQEKDIVSLSKNIDDKTKTQIILKDKLNQKTADFHQLEDDKNTLFNNLEQFKQDSHNNIVDMQAKFNVIINEKNQNIDNWTNKQNRLDEELEKTIMSYNMQLATEKFEIEKNICCTIKDYNITKTSINDINQKNVQTLKKSNEEMMQLNLNLKKENNIMASEKILLNNELTLCDKNNDDAVNEISNLETDLNKTLNAKEAESLTNHGLRQNQIDLNGKNDLLDREYKNLTDNMIDLNNDNNHLSKTVENIESQLLNSNKDCDNLRTTNKLAYDDHLRRSTELENLKQQTSEITLKQEHDLTVLNKSLNNIQSTQSMRLREREKQYQDRCHENEFDKNNMINEFNDVRVQKENIIKDLNNDLENNRVEFKNVIDNLTTQNISLENELTNVSFENDNIKSDINKSKAQLEGEIVLLQNLNVNIIDEMKIKEAELLHQIETLTNDIIITDNNGEKLSKDKNSTIQDLENINANLEKDCDVQTNLNKDLTFSKNNLTEDLDKCKQEYSVIKDELSTQINLINHTIKERKMYITNQIHDSECQRLSRDETLRTLEEKLGNIHEQRICKEKELLNIIADLNIDIDDKTKEYDTYQIDTEKQKSLLQGNNEVKDLKIKELETNLINLDKQQCQTRSGLEKDIMNVNSNILVCDKTLDDAQSQIKIQNITLSELNERNNKLTSELVMNQDSHYRDKQIYGTEIKKINKDLQDLNFNLSDVKLNLHKITSERNEILMQKEIEKERQTKENERISEELNFEKAKRFDIDQLDRFNYNRIKEMEKANEYWRIKYGALEKEKKNAMHAASNSRIELAEVKDIIKRQKQ